jgi:hypothetical protein
MMANGIIIPGDYKAEDVQFPNWDNIVKKEPRMLYFANENIKKGLGAQCLVISAIYQEERMPNFLVVDENDVTLHLKLAQLVNTCTRTQRSLLADIVRLVEDSTTRKIHAKSLENSGVASQSSVLIPPIPVSDEDMRREFQSNRYSLLNNLPCPRVSYNCQHDIAFSNFEDCVADFLAHGVPFSGLEKSKINKKLDEILSNDSNTEVLVSFGKK